MELIFEVLGVVVVGSELPHEVFVAHKLRLVLFEEAEGLVGRPSIQIECQRRLAQRLQRPDVDRDGGRNDSVIKILPQFNPALPALSFNMPSASGLLQILPRQTIRIFMRAKIGIEGNKGQGTSLRYKFWLDLYLTLELAPCPLFLTPFVDLFNTGISYKTFQS